MVEILCINGAEMAAESFGDQAAPALVLVAGAEMSMDFWDTALCQKLAGRGLFVIRYDLRDTGESTCYPPGAPGYTFCDLVNDLLGLLEHFEIDRAHLLGISMGGGLVQQFAVDHSERVASLVLMSTSYAGPGQDGLPAMSQKLTEAFEHPPPEPDWSDREQVVRYFLEAELLLGGAIAPDPDRIRALAGRMFERSPHPASIRNHWQIPGDGSESSLKKRLAGVTAATLILHGSDDPLFPYGHGRALSELIPGAALVKLQGMGHQVPPPELWDFVVDKIAGHILG